MTIIWNAVYEMEMNGYHLRDHHTVLFWKEKIRSICSWFVDLNGKSDGKSEDYWEREKNEEKSENPWEEKNENRKRSWIDKSKKINSTIEIIVSYSTEWTLIISFDKKEERRREYLQSDWDSSLDDHTPNRI